MHRGVVELHVDLAGDHCDVVDRVGAVVARGHAGRELDHPEGRAARQRGTRLALAGVLLAVVVDREALGRPDIAGRRPGPAGEQMLGDLVDLHGRLTLAVVTRDHPPDPERHGFISWREGGTLRGLPLPIVGYATPHRDGRQGWPITSSSRRPKVSRS